MSEDVKVNRTRIMEKIQKCMDMAKDQRGNANEAANAMRQAQALMRKHSITGKEMGAVGFNKMVIFTTIQAGKFGGPLPLTLTTITSLISHVFGVRCIITRAVRKTDLNYNITYYGPETRTGLAHYAHTVAQRAVDQAWKEYIESHPLAKGRHGARAGFYIGWLNEVRGKVEELIVTEQETEGTNLAVAKDFDSVGTAKQNKQAVYGQTVRAGARAAEDFSIHRPVEREFSKIGYDK